MNKKIASHLQYTAWIYILVAVVVFALWTTVFHAISSVKYDEKVTVMLFSDDDFSEALKADISQNINDITAQELKEFSIEKRENDLSVMQSLVQGRIPVRDLFIFSEGVLNNTDPEEYNPSGMFVAIKDEKLGGLFGEGLSESQIYRVDGYAYGIYLNDPDDGVTNNFEKIYSGKTRYVILFSYESLNMAGAFGKGETENSAAVDIVKYLISEQRTESKK